MADDEYGAIGFELALALVDAVIRENPAMADTIEKVLKAQRDLAQSESRARAVERAQDIVKASRGRGTGSLDAPPGFVRSVP